MKLLTTICIPALLLGAAALSTPVMAQSAPQPDASTSSNAAAAAPAQPAQDANSAAVPAQTASTDTSASTPAAASGNTQLAMNTTGNASDLSSVPDNQHKYSRAKKPSEDRSEDQTTKDLNQKESSLNGTTAQ
jgi:DsbC/DsbD-like thiol-disulfide interchange protein